VVANFKPETQLGFEGYDRAVPALLLASPGQCFTSLEAMSAQLASGTAPTLPPVTAVAPPSPEFCNPLTVPSGIVPLPISVTLLLVEFVPFLILGPVLLGLCPHPYP